MSYINPELKKWLDEQIARGCTAESMVEAMEKAGHIRYEASRMVAEAFSQQAQNVLAAVQPAPRPVIPSIKTRLINTPNLWSADDQAVKILFTMAVPRVVLFGDFLSSAECDALVKASRSKIQQALVIDPATGNYVPDPGRTSEGTHFERGESPVVIGIEKRIEALMGYAVPTQEPLQILHYGVGGEYRPHFDYFNPNEQGGRVALKRGGQRIATLIMYLNDVDGGGATIFPSIGLEVRPRKGNAIYFESYDDAGQLAPTTLHGGAPVETGEKWIATKWMREAPYV